MPLTHSLYRALKMAFQSTRWLLIGAFATQILVALGTPAQLWIGRVLVDRVAGGSSRQGVVFIAVWLIGVMLATRLSALANSSLLTLARDHSAADAVSLYLEKAATIDAGYFIDPGFLDRMRHAGEVADDRFSSVMFGICGLVGAVSGLFGLGTLLASISPLVTVLVVLSMVPWIIAEQKGFNIVRIARLSLLHLRRRQIYLRDLVTDPDSALELIAHGSGPLISRRHRELSVDLLRLERPAHLHQFSLIAFGGLIGAVFLGIAFAVAVTSAVDATASPGDVAAMIGGLTAFLMTTGVFANSISGLLVHGPYLADYFTFLETPPLLKRPSRPRMLPKRLSKVAFDNVHYSYPGSGAPALAQVSLEIRPGELFALVGENGAGKSTLVKLLLRFYDPDAGSIFFDGVDIQDCDPREVRARIGVVFQDFARYQFTLRDSVGVARPGKVVDKEVEDALNTCGLGGLSSMPEGLNTQIGRIFPNGKGLSGGQWQKLAIARIYYRNPEILVLDEPTSALDPRSEFATFIQLRERLENRCGLVISHRFSTVRGADRIGVMHDGRLVESGTHEQLVRKGGQYASLFAAQAESFKG